MLALVGGVVAAAACGDGGTEWPRSGSAAIVNGTPEANPEISRFVQVRAKSMSASLNTASGVLLDGKTVLTCAHCLDTSQCPSTPTVDGNVSRVCRFNAGSQVVKRANGTTNHPFIDPNIRIPNRVSVHPLFKNLEGKTQGDIAILHLETPFAGVTTIGPSAVNNADLVAQKAQITCYGYGDNTLTSGSNTLRSGVFQVSGFADQVAFKYDKTVAGVIHWRGDSGGPCLLNGAVAGIMRNNAIAFDDAGAVSSVTDGRVVGAEAFRCWKDHVADQYAIWDLNEDMPSIFGPPDGMPDSVVIKRHVPCGLFSPTGFCYSVKILYSPAAFSPLCETMEVVFAPDLGLSISTVDLATGDFNKDGAIDFVGQINNIPFALNGVAGDVSKLVDAQLSFLTSQYSKFYVVDIDGDTVDDVEALTPGGQVDTYFGCPKTSTTCTPGLSEKYTTNAFPTADRFDGRFVIITGTGDGTYPAPKLTMTIGSKGPKLSVDVFDGYFGSGYDRPFGAAAISDSCFRLFADKLADGTGTKAVVSGVNASTLRENEWSKLYHDAQDPAAQDGGSGDYWYRLEVTQGDCAGTKPAIPNAVNAFKVRTNGAVQPVDEFSFWGQDRVGAAAPAVSFLRPPYDTSYDGTFLFPMYVPDHVSCFQFEETDADNASDADVLINGPDDVKAPSQENVASNLFYTLLGKDGASILYTNSDPSGQCSPLLGPVCDHELTPKVTVGANKGGFYFWQWSDKNAASNKRVYSGNEIHAWYPLIPLGCESSSGTGAAGAGAAGATQQQAGIVTQFDGPRLTLYGTLPRLSVTHTSALTRTAWLAKSPAEISTLLPLVLGELNSCGKAVGGSVNLTTVVQVLEILGGGKKNPPKKEALLSQLRAELLATKLNLANAKANAEPMSAAFVYGSRATVASTTTFGDGVVSRACPGLVCPHEFGCGNSGPNSVPPGKGGSDSASDSEIEIATMLLAAVNARHVEYRAP
ncbi:MAG: trypsin-like serine protease [Candidatus Eisenbacteria bacterium]|nr:trypsin-like serine protease [Candidatus Eisenbacteria bacterium]